ncbi:hypothetical protein SAMN04487897_101501 [Paenibacillus sp. yr247]|uniref:hypothetical protein n=1 Tax=Paenibacillus sp. yr247 TaxID=1761880 RepID=UPI0008808967|nr:hypothetical protein [Paenibacillus sp. yr247]SDM92463.1 hypothetical protein SAMN04487897_101501 [Paenibacillus sp. yr247]
MNQFTEHLVNQHRQYLSENTKELENYGSIYEHMLFYLTSILGIDKQKALQCISDLKADMSCDLLKNIVQSEII